MDVIAVSRLVVLAITITPVQRVLLILIRLALRVPLVRHAIHVEIVVI